MHACVYRHVLLCVWHALDTSVHICEHTPHRVYTCARVRVVCPSALGDEGVGVQLVYAGPEESSVMHPSP